MYCNSVFDRHIYIPFYNVDDAGLKHHKTYIVAEDPTETQYIRQSR